MQPFNAGSHMFEYLHFPLFDGGDGNVRQFLELHMGQPYHEACSDFGLLTYLARKIDVDLVVELAKSVKNRTPLEANVMQRLDEALLKYG